MNFKKNRLALLLLFCFHNNFAQSGKGKIFDTIKTKPLEEIIISSKHINDSLQNAPASIRILSASDLQRNNHTDISIVMNTIAGVYMQSSNLTTNRITIRGIGARTPFGTNKIRAFYGSIPLTSGNSETIIDDIDIENIGQIEVIKGPISSVYGAGLGGAIIISPKKLNNTGNTSSITTVHGSYGLLKNSFNFSFNKKKSAHTINFHNLQTDGWRENSSYQRKGVTASGELFRKKNSQLSYLTNYTYLKAFIPSSINKITFDNNPSAGAPNWVASKGFKEYKSLLAGLSYDWNIKKVKNSTSVFINYKDNNEPRPFDILQQYTFAKGIRTQFTGNFYASKREIRFNIGLEYFNDNYNGNTAENIYLKNNGLGSLEGNKLTENQQNRNFFNAFSQFRFLFSEKLELQSGLNINKTSFNLENIFPAKNTSNENYSFNTILSPQLSVLFKPANQKTIYFSASRGFSLPSVEETLTESGTINTEIKPESGYNFEIGGKFYFFDQSFYTEVAIFFMNIKDQLVAQRVGDDQYVGVNAGKTLHQGIEIAANYNWQIDPNFIIDSYISTSMGTYKFKEFSNRGTNFSGNDLTGVPAFKANAGITFKTSLGIYLSSDFQFVDKIPLNDSNSIYANSYHIINLKTGYQFKITSGFSFQVSAGINNVANTSYASLILPNATAVGTALPRYYYPGMPVNYYGNLSVAYSF